MKTTKLYTGGTGCGKTYKAITEAKSFVIAVPCRQLAYEIYWDFPQISRLDTGEVHLGDASGNQVCVYENLSDNVISQDRLIIDEAHYLNDPERGGVLFEKILANRRAGKEIILLTATDTLSDEVKAVLEVEEVELQSFKTPPKKVQISEGAFYEKVRAGMKAIIFVKYTPSEFDVERYALTLGIDESEIGILSANTPSFERVKAQLDFKEGKLRVVVATNVLAQGLNFPAEGVLIEHNEWDDWEVVTQKMGRVARPLSGLREGYYCLRTIPVRFQKSGVPSRVQRESVTYRRPSGNVIDTTGWGVMTHEVPTNFGDYKNFKYSYRFLRKLADRHGYLEQAEQSASDFLENQSMLLKQLLSQRDVD